MADNRHNNTHARETARQNARDEVTKRWYEHAKLSEAVPSYESIRKHVHSRAEIQDKKRDWGK